MKPIIDKALMEADRSAKALAKARRALLMAGHPKAVVEKAIQEGLLMMFMDRCVEAARELGITRPGDPANVGAARKGDHMAAFVEFGPIEIRLDAGHESKEDVEAFFEQYRQASGAVAAQPNDKEMN